MMVLRVFGNVLQMLLVFSLGLGCGMMVSTARTVPCTIGVWNQPINEDALVLAFAHCESGNINRPAHWDVSQYSWGVYQFGPDRWRECGGSSEEWAAASVSRQRQVMQVAVARYLRAGRKRGLDGEKLVVWAGNFHNIGHGSIVPSAYTLKLISLYRKALRGAL